MALAAPFRRTLTLAIALSLVSVALPFGSGISPAFAAPSGTLTISDAGGGSLPAPSGGVYEITSNISVPSADIESALGSGNVVLHATEITVASDIDAPNTNALTLKSSGSIEVEAGITSAGGDLIFWADSDSDGDADTSGGHIGFASGSSANSGGGDIILGGGDAAGGDPGRPGGPATGAFTTGLMGDGGGSNGTAGVALLGATLDAGAGNVSISAMGTGTSLNYQMGLAMSESEVEGAVVSLEGVGSQNALGASGTSSNFGVLVRGTTITSAVSIDVQGTGGGAPSSWDTNHHGVFVRSGTGASEIEATGSGSLTITGSGGGGNGSSQNGTGLYVELGQTIRSDSGDILLEGTASKKENQNAVWLRSAPVSSSGDISIEGKPHPSTGVIRPVVLTGATATSGVVSISSPGPVSQTAPITAASLALQGPAAFTLTNSSNAFGTIAAGTSSSQVASLSLFDASGGLTVGTVGSLNGVSASGDVLIETGAGDITLAQGIATDSTSSTAITVNAGKSTAAGTGTGGDTVVSGSPTLTTGTGGIVKMFSGSEAGSNGLTTLIGGSSNVYYGVDETSTPDPALSAGTKYALYRSTVESPPGSGGSSGGSGGASGDSGTPAPEVVTPAVTPRPAVVVPVVPNTDPVPRPVERLGFVFDPNAPARASIAGSASNLSTTLDGVGGLSVVTGAFQFGVRLAEPDGDDVQTDTPSQSPELLIPRGAAVATSGDGAYPGSFVQVWLPGDGGDSRELARIPVRSDGTFTSDLRFEAGSMEMPVPVGRQVLQVVGYDEQGNQTVVDMTVNVGQGVPAPEPNRQVGELPVLSLGQSLSTSGGIPETVVVTALPDVGSVVVEGSGWTVSVNADRDNGVVENSDGSLLVRLGQSSVGDTVGTGFMPGTLATVWLFSDPTVMATVTVDDSGGFSAEFLVDARLIAPGEHTLQVQGVGADGYIKAANLGVLVEQPVEVTSESASGVLWWVASGLLLFLLVLFFVIVARRRRA